MPDTKLAPLGILLINLGTPDEPTTPAIRRYLKEFLKDPRVVSIPRLIWLPILYGFILPFRPSSLVERYSSIWTEKGGPIRHFTETLANKTAQKLNDPTNNRSVIVRSAMTYGNPSIQSSLQSLMDDGASDVLLLPLFPQYSAATTAACLDKFNAVVSRFKYLPNFHFTAQYHLETSYIDALVSSIQASPGFQQTTKDHLLFSFHGLPEAQVAAGDPYPEQCHATAEAVVKRLGLRQDQYDICFQSRFGPAEWLKPYTSDCLAALPAAGKKHISIICPGFAADCLETLEEIEVENKQVFIQAGGQSFSYIEALNASDAHVDVMAQLIAKVYPELSTMRLVP